MSDMLNVYLRERPVGRLWLGEGRRFSFQYDQAWLADPQAVPLSLTLPLRLGVYADDTARPFFANLLPESELRRIIARKLGLSEQNDFALLEAVGGECAGAVSLLPDDHPPEDPVGNRSNYHALDDDELNALIADLPNRPMLAGERGIRLSLAGAQNKLPVLFDGERISLPMGGAPSSHILKPPIPHYPDSVLNESFCMQLALRIGLVVPPVSILHKQQPLYLVERYDRRRLPDGRLHRVHQEDFCQALGIAPDQKYEKEGGPSLTQCFDLVRRNSVQPVADVQALLRWVVFNYLIGNADAHGKNVSLLLDGQGPRLAPFYDLMSTAAYPGLSERLAMRLGGEDRPDWIIERRWRRFADDVGIGFRLVRQTLMNLKKQVSTQAHDLAQGFRAEQGECDVVDRIVGVIAQRATKITNTLAADGL
jgi:serine/threonine-protein kinase HipA